MSFLQSYKRLDNLCKDIFSSESGVTSYIESMESIPAGAYKISGWHDDYLQLKHYRYVRNRIVHDNYADEDTLCNEGDVEWLETFCQRIMNSQDPLALYRKATSPTPRKTPQPTYAYTPSSPPKRNYGCLLSMLLVLSIIVIIALLISR